MGPNVLFLASKLHLIASKYLKSEYQKLDKSVDIVLLCRSLKHESDYFLQLQKIVTFTELSRVLYTVLKPET